MKTARCALASLCCCVLVLVSFGSCGGPAARAPSAAGPSLPRAFVEAFGVDAVGRPHDAVLAYLSLVRAAARAEGDPWQVSALEASLDALDARVMPSLGRGARDAALAYRTLDERAIADGLRYAANESRGPFARGLIARGLEMLARRRGDAVDSGAQRAASGCVREALVVGPVTWAAVTGVYDADPLDSPDAPIAAVYDASRTFPLQLRPIPTSAEGCSLGLSQQSWRPGVRDVIVDVDVPRAQVVGLVLRAHGAATLRAGGVVVARRAFDLGDGEAARFVEMTAAPGPLRLVARVGTAKEDDAVEIDAFGEDGLPLRSRAPAPGSPPSRSRISASSVVAIEPPVAKTEESQRDDALLLAAAAAIASGSPRDAERMLWGIADRPGARPDLALVYGRAVESARDLSAATRAERGRSAFERVLAAWPQSWEATVAHAVLAGARRGREEAGIESLRDLDAARSKAPPASSLWQSGSMLDAFDALTSGDERLFDRARAALDRAKRSLLGTSLFADAEDATSPQVGADRVTRVCDPPRQTSHESLDCLDALRAAGNRSGEWRELARLRTLLGAPSRYLAIELRDAGDDLSVARRAFNAMAPAEQTMTAFAWLAQAPPEEQRVGPGLGTPWLDARDLRERLMQLAATARDAPLAIGPLLRAGGDDPGSVLDERADRLAAADRANPLMANSGTAILTHSERYEITPEGLLHWVLFDVRRVSGTTDVEEGAQAPTPVVWGRTATRALRRRILKRDGRVLEPDRTPHASQEHADLSQLEQGDAVEAVYEGWASPGDTGDIGIDTPDLLPERTAVKEATIELRIPAGIHEGLWSHRLLGKPIEHTVSGSRIFAWRLHDQAARRMEDGVPKMDQSVAVSFSTAQWTGIARALRESIAALDEHGPEAAAWARAAAGPIAADKTTRDTVDAVVVAAGKALREADPGTLSDYGGGIPAVQSQTARTFLAAHDGSRSWLILRALRVLGIPCDLVVAENDPFSADPAFPAHFGRFLHPLVVAHVPTAKEHALGNDEKGRGLEDVWIDADVAGPPLPAGRISPELRGRLALSTDGTIVPLPNVSPREDERDEVDVRLALDDNGDARGTFAVVLRGRDAQELSEALFRIVGAERQRALRDVVLAWLPWANVDDVNLASTEGSWQVSLRAAVSISGYAQLEASHPHGRDKTARIGLLPGLDTLHWAWPRARVSSLAATFATRAGRESALALGAAVQYHFHRRVDLPKGAAVTRIPGPLEVKTHLVEASRKMTVAAAATATSKAAVPGETAAIEDDFVLDVGTGTIPADEYDAFVAGAHAADDGFLAAVRIAMP